MHAGWLIGARRACGGRENREPTLLAAGAARAALGPVAGYDWNRKATPCARCS